MACPITNHSNIVNPAFKRGPPRSFPGSEQTKAESVGLLL
jgi:hypothetical protein